MESWPASGRADASAPRDGLTSARSGRARRGGGGRCSPSPGRVAERRERHELDVVRQPEHLARDVGVEGGDPAGAEPEGRRREDEMIHGDGRVDLAVGLVVHAPPRLVRHGDEGEDERGLCQPAAPVDAGQLLFPALACAPRSCGTAAGWPPSAPCAPPRAPWRASRPRRRRACTRARCSASRSPRTRPWGLLHGRRRPSAGEAGGRRLRAIVSRGRPARAAAAR